MSVVRFLWDFLSFAKFGLIFDMLTSSVLFCRCLAISTTTKDDSSLFDKNQLFLMIFFNFSGVVNQTAPSLVVLISREDVWSGQKTAKMGLTISSLFNRLFGKKQVRGRVDKKPDLIFGKIFNPPLKFIFLPNTQRKSSGSYSDGGFGCGRKDDDPLQAETRRNC